MGLQAELYGSEYIILFLDLTILSITSFDL